MSRTIYTDLSRMIVVAGILAGAGLIRPGVAVAQTVSPEQAMLNRAAGSSLPGGFGTIFGAPADPAVTAQVSGEQVLLGRTAPRNWTLASEPAAVPTPTRRAPINGEQALLERQDRIEAVSR